MSFWLGVLAALSLLALALALFPQFSVAYTMRRALDDNGLACTISYLEGRWYVDIEQPVGYRSEITVGQGSHPSLREAFRLALKSVRP